MRSCWLCNASTPNSCAMPPNPSGWVSPLPRSSTATAADRGVSLMRCSATHLVLIPSYNPGGKVFDTVAAARAQWGPVWVVVDGSNDGTAEALVEMARTDEGLRVLVLPRNRGKGAAVLHGAEQALRLGFTHLLTMDSDGQHPAERIQPFMAASQAHPEAMILGEPQFD